VPDLENQRLKARYADAIPLDLFKSEQERITRELAGAQQIIGRCSMEINAVLRVVEEALLLCADAHRLHLSATPDVRRELNQAVFARFWAIDDPVRARSSPNPSHNSSLPTWPPGLRPKAQGGQTLPNRPTAPPSVQTAATKPGRSDVPAKHTMAQQKHPASPSAARCPETRSSSPPGC